MIEPQYLIFLAYYPIIPHHICPILSSLINVQVPYWSFRRIIFVSYFDAQQSLHIIVNIFVLLVVERDEISIKLVSLLLVKCNPIHDVGQSQFRFICMSLELQNFSGLRMLYFNNKCLFYLAKLVSIFPSAEAKAISTFTRFY